MGKVTQVDTEEELLDQGNCFYSQTSLREAAVPPDKHNH